MMNTFKAIPPEEYGCEAKLAFITELLKRPDPMLTDHPDAVAANLALDLLGDKNEIPVADRDHYLQIVLMDDNKNLWNVYLNALKSEAKNK